MELFIFARFHARPGNGGAVAEALLDILARSREEPGCLSIHTFRSICDLQLFYIHSHWKDEAAFEYHAGLSHTVRLVERAEPLIDHPVDVTRAERIGEMTVYSAGKSVHDPQDLPRGKSSRQPFGGVQG